MTRKVIKTLGFLGTGVMGTPMVRRLLAAGFAVRVWNRTSAKTDSLQTLGAVNSKSPAEAADGVDALLLCLSTPQRWRQRYLGVWAWFKLQ